MNSCNNTKANPEIYERSINILQTFHFCEFQRAWNYSWNFKKFICRKKRKFKPCMEVSLLLLHHVLCRSLIERVRHPWQPREKQKKTKSSTWKRPWPSSPRSTTAGSDTTNSERTWPESGNRRRDCCWTCGGRTYSSCGKAVAQCPCRNRRCSPRKRPIAGPLQLLRPSPPPPQSPSCFSLSLSLSISVLCSVPNWKSGGGEDIYIDRGSVGCVLNNGTTRRPKDSGTASWISRHQRSTSRGLLRGLETTHWT